MPADKHIMFFSLLVSTALAVRTFYTVSAATGVTFLPSPDWEREGGCVCVFEREKGVCVCVCVCV